MSQPEESGKPIEGSVGPAASADTPTGGDDSAAPVRVPYMACSECKSPMRDRYFALNERPICAKCKPAFAKRIERGDTATAFVRAAFRGLLAAVIGAVALAAMVTAFPFGRIFLLIPIGYFVGKTVMAAVDGHGGRRYQYLAVALTYSALSFGQLVPAIREAEDAAKRREAIRADTNRTLATQGLALEEALKDLAGDSSFAELAGAAAGGTRQGNDAARENENSTFRQLVLWFLFLPVVAMLGFGIHVSAVGILALGYALYQAWTRTDGHGLDLKLTGPFRVGRGPIPAAM